MDWIPAQMHQRMASPKHAAVQPAAAAAAVAVGGRRAGPWVQTHCGAQKPGRVVAHQPCGAYAGQQQHWSGGGTGHLGAEMGSLPHLASHAGSGRAAGGALVGPLPE